MLQSTYRWERIKIDEKAVQRAREKKEEETKCGCVREPLRAFQRYRHAKLIFKLAIRNVFWPYREDCAMCPGN